MSLKDTLKKSLTPELFTQVVDTLGDDFDYDVVPRTRLNKVISQRNDYKKQLEDPGTDSGDHGDSSDEPDGGQAKSYSQKDVDKMLKDLKDQHTAEIESIARKNAAVSILSKNGAIDPELVIKSGLLDLTKMTKGDDGSYSGLDDTIKTLKENKGFLFGDTDDHQSGTGKKDSDDGGSKDSKLDEALNQIFGIYSPDSE